MELVKSTINILDIIQIKNYRMNGINLEKNHFEYEIISEIKEKEDEEKDYKQEVKDLEELFNEELQPFEEKDYNNK